MEGKEKNKQKTITEWLQNLHCGLWKCRGERGHATGIFGILLNCVKTDGMVNPCYMYFVIVKAFHMAPSWGLHVWGGCSRASRVLRGKFYLPRFCVCWACLCCRKPRDSSTGQFKELGTCQSCDSFSFLIWKVGTACGSLCYFRPKSVCPSSEWHKQKRCWTSGAHCPHRGNQVRGCRDSTLWRLPKEHPKGPGSVVRLCLCSDK